MSDVVSKITIALNDQASSGMKGIGAEVDNLRGKVSSFGSALSNIGTGIGISAGMAGLSGISDVLSEGFSTSLRIENLDATYSAIYDGAAKAKQELAFIRAEADRLGLSFLDTADSAKMFFASSKGSSIEKDAKDIFSAFSELAVTMRLSKEQTSGMFLALGQSASKGKLMAQELREQLGEKVPGIFRVIADSLGVTTTQLDKMLEEGKVGLDALAKAVPVIRERFGSALPEAVNSTTAAIGRLNTKWDDLMAHSANTDALKAGINGLTGVLEMADRGVVALSEHSDVLTSIMATSIAGYAALTAAKKLSSSETLKAVASSTKERGALGAIRTSLLEVADAEYRKAQQTNAAAKSAVAAAEAEIAAAQRAKAALTASLSRVSGDEAVNAVRTKLSQTEARLASQTLRASAAQKAASASADALAASSARLNIAAGSVSGNVGKLTGAATLLKTAGSGLLAMLGGPWGIAFTAAAAGVGYLATQSSQADGVVASLAEKFDQTAKAAMSSGEAVKKFNAAYKEMLERSARQELGKAVQQLEMARKEAESFTDPTMWNGMVSALQRGASGWTTVSQIVSDYRSGLITSEEAFKRLNNASDRFGENNDNVAEGTRLVKALAQGAQEVAEKEAGVAAVAKAAGEIGSAAASSALSVDDLAQALDVLRNMKLDSTLLPDPSTMKLPALLTEIGKNLKNTEPFKKQAIETTKEWTKQAIAAARAQLQSAEATGKDTTAIKAAIEFLKKADEGVTDLGKSHRSQEGAANRAAKAISSYQEELAKLTQSSRELEQVKIEEKLAKIAKDAKLPAAEMEKLRKAMEHEADFKWMQDILSYADPAAAAIAKENKEFEAFRRNIERLKTQDPAKYTQLMAKAETEHEKALRKAERASKEQNEHLQEKLSFYKELEEMSGAFGLSLEVQNRLLDEQMEIFRDADIPENLIQTWRQYKDLMNSHDWADGAQRAFLQYRADATDAAKGAEEAFSGLYSGMDSGWKSAWEQMIETGKVSLSSFRSVFASFLADLMHMAITRPITVQIAGVVSGMLGTDGVAYASGGSGGVGGMSNLSGVSNLMPGSWTSGIADTINNTMAGWFPSTFASTSAVSSAANAGVMSATGGAADVAGLKAAEAASSLGGNTTFLSTVSPYLMAGGLGSLGYTMLGGALGLPQSKYSGLTAGLGGAAGWGLGSLAAGSFASIGATMGSVVPVVGTIIGALAGGALGSLFGQERKTHPSVYGHMMGQGYTTDTQAYIDAFMNQATYDRAGKTEASAYAQVIGEAASQTAGNILNLAAMLPDEYKKNVEDQLESATWSAGRGFSGASWNIQNWKEGMAEKDLQEAIGDMFEQMGYGANKAFAEAGIGDLFDSFDLSTEEGFKKAQTAISAISSITTAIDEIKAPTSEAEQQAKAFVAQMDALGEAVKASGLNAAYADEMLSDYRTAYVDNYVNSLEEMFNPLSQIEQQAKGYKTAIDGYVAALTTMGASEAQLAQVRGYTQDAIDNITGSLDAAFFPLSSVEQQTKSTMESLLAYKAALETLGASAEEMTRIDAAWGKMQADLLDKARAYVSTTPEVVSQAAAMNAEFDALRKAMELAGNATADLTELEQTRAQAVAALQAQYAESFRQTYAQRYATLTGDTNGLANLQQQASFASELAEIEKTWGKDSEQYRQMQALQDAEAAKQRLEQAQAAYDALQAQLEKQQAELKQLEQQAVQLQIEEIQKLQTASKERIAALEKELSAAQKLHDTWEDVFATAYAKRVDLYQGNTNLDVFGRLDTAQGEFDRLYGLAIGGDADAAKEMAGVASELLGLRGETTANRDDYLNAFYDVDKKLKEVSAYADAQVSDAQKQIDTLQAQLEAENAQYSILVSQLSAQQAALSALNGQTQTLASIQAQIAKLKTEINITIDGKNVASSTVGNAQGDYDDAKDHVDQTKPVVGIYGSKYLTEYDLLVAKVASLNRGEFVNADADTRDWTVAKARQAMIGEYGSVKNWYLQIGKPVEGFERGGLATPGGPKMFGERGIEYGDVEQPTRIYDATKTRLMLEGGHEYAREAYKGMSEFSRMLARTSGARGDGNKEETAALRKEVRELRGMLKAMLTSVVKNTKDARDFLEEFEETGLPPQRVNA